MGQIYRNVSAWNVVCGGSKSSRKKLATCWGGPLEDLDAAAGQSLLEGLLEGLLGATGDRRVHRPQEAHPGVVGHRDREVDVLEGVDLVRGGGRLQDVELRDGAADVERESLIGLRHSRVAEEEEAERPVHAPCGVAQLAGGVRTERRRLLRLQSRGPGVDPGRRRQGGDDLCRGQPADDRIMDLSSGKGLGSAPP